MKKLKFLVFAILICFLFPLSMGLVSCGVVVNSKETGVAFISKVRNEEGLSVFEVDLNDKTKLNYKVYPSNTGAEVKFDTIDYKDGTNLNTYIRDKEFVTVLDDDFKDIKVEIMVGSYKDHCIVTLKRYPESIYIGDENGNPITEEIINAKGNYSVHIFGLFKIWDDKDRGEFHLSDPIELSDDDYNFLVESEDKSIVGVDNENRLKINAVKGRSGQSTIKVSLQNMKRTKIIKNSQDEELSVELDVSSVENVGKCYFYTNKTDEFFGFDFDGSYENIPTVNINASDFDEGTDLTIDDEFYTFTMNFDYYLFSTEKSFLESDFSHTSSSSNIKYVSIDDENNEISIKVSKNNMQRVDYKFNFTVYIGFELNNSSGRPYMFIFNVELNNDLVA